MAKSEAYKVAREVYGRFTDETGGFVGAEAKLAIRAALEMHRGDAFDALVDSAYAKAEESHKKQADGRQGHLFDVGGVLILRDDRRIGLKWAMKSHYKESLAIKRDNAEAVVRKLEADEQWLEALDPYWPEGRPCFQAVEQYKQDHPEAKSA